MNGIKVSIKFKKQKPKIFNCSFVLCVFFCEANLNILNIFFFKPIQFIHLVLLRKIVSEYFSLKVSMRVDDNLVCSGLEFHTDVVQSCFLYSFSFMYLLKTYFHWDFFIFLLVLVFIDEYDSKYNRICGSF